MRKVIRTNWQYVAWFAFYFILFGILTAGVAIIFYLVTVPLAFSSVAENLWRRVAGVRPLRLKREKDGLLPLFHEVYNGALTIDPSLPRNIRLYIQEDMSINAYAFGKSTLVLTRGSVELLNDECLKGLMAHELGHFSNGDTIAELFRTVSILPISFIIKKLTDIKNGYESKESIGLFQSAVKAIVDIFYYFFRGIEFIGDLFLMRVSRKHEYQADTFALKSGFGKNLADVLTEIYSVSIEKPQSVKEQFKSTHPAITLRIEQLEKAIY